jgi:hypothetical protein
MIFPSIDSVKHVRRDIIEERFQHRHFYKDRTNTSISEKSGNECDLVHTLSVWYCTILQVELSNTTGLSGIASDPFIGCQKLRKSSQIRAEI